MATRGFKPESVRQNEDFARAVRIAIEKNGIDRNKVMRMAGVSSASFSKKIFCKKALAGARQDARGRVKGVLQDAQVVR